MTDHQPRLLDSADASTRALLESALRDRAPASGPARTAMALGLGDVGVPEPTVSEAAGVLPGLAVGKATTSVLTASVFAGTGKWLAMGLIAGSAASLGSFAIQQRAQPGAVPRATERPMATAPLTPRQRPAPGTPVVSAESELVAARPPASHSAASASAAATPPSSAAALALDTTGAMARETAWIDQARAALRRSDTAGARANLATYAAERRVGVLDREALLLSVELAVAEGDRGRALQLAADFAAKYPHDAHLPRVRQLVAKSAP